MGSHGLYEDVRSQINGLRMHSHPVPHAQISVEVGSGELIDKITILQIKAERIDDPVKLAHVRHELAALEAARRAHLDGYVEIGAIEADLRAVNERLWMIEDDLREHEAAGNFGPRFIELARAVYKNNDRRAALKKEINAITGSAVVEEKSYRGFGAGG